MSITRRYSPGPLSRKLYTSRLDEVDLKQARAKLAKMARQGCMTRRDEFLLMILREVRALSLDQVQRLLWPQAKVETARRRLSVLSSRYELVGRAHLPPGRLAAWGLVERNIYILGKCGWLYLNEEITPERAERHQDYDRLWHDLLMAELYVRVSEAAWGRGKARQVSWAGSEGVRFCDPKGGLPGVAADGLAVVESERKISSMFIELEGVKAKDWQRKIEGYDRFYAGNWQAEPDLSELPKFPYVLIITRGERRLLKLARLIMKQRREPAVYGLATWDDLMASDDILSARVWLVIAVNGGMVPERQALF